MQDGLNYCYCPLMHWTLPSVAGVVLNFKAFSLPLAHTDTFLSALLFPGQGLCSSTTNQFFLF